MVSPVKVWRNQKKTARLIGKTGTIVAFTLVRVPPSDFTNQAPYPVVIVDLAGGEPFVRQPADQGKRITAQLVDWEDKHLVVGQPVVTVVRRIMEPTCDGVIYYGIKVKPIK